MTYTLHFLPEVEGDVIGGYAWYEAKSPGLGEEFLRIFYACAEEISQNPLLYPKAHNEFRRWLTSASPRRARSSRSIEPFLPSLIFSHGHIRRMEKRKPVIRPGSYISYNALKNKPVSFFTLVVAYGCLRKQFFSTR